MQASGVIVPVQRRRWVELHDPFITSKEQSPDVAHIAPSRRDKRADDGYADVIPSTMIARQDAKRSPIVRDQESPVVPTILVAEPRAGRFVAMNFDSRNRLVSHKNPRPFMAVRGRRQEPCAALAFVPIFYPPIPLLRIFPT